MQDHGQGHCKKNATRGQYFKVCQVCHGQGHPQEIAELLLFLLYFPIGYVHPGLNMIMLHSHPLKGSLLLIHYLSL